MTTLPRTAIVVALVACLGLTSCGGKSDKKVARKFKPGDQLYRESMFSDEEHIKRTGKPFTPEQKAFFHTCTKITFGMSEQDIDAIMSAYPSHRRNSPDPDEKEAGRYIKVYDEKIHMADCVDGRSQPYFDEK